MADLGIDYNQSKRWQLIAGLPEPAFETYIAETKAHAQELMSAGALPLRPGLPHVRRPTCR